jgi:hypothetical protein
METSAEQTDKIAFLQLMLERAEKSGRKSRGGENNSQGGRSNNSFTPNAMVGSASGYVSRSESREGIVIPASQPQTPTHGHGPPPLASIASQNAKTTAMSLLNTGDSFQPVIAMACGDCEDKDTKIVNLITEMSELSTRIDAQDAALGKAIGEKELAEELSNNAFNSKLHIEAVRDTLQEKVRSDVLRSLCNLFAQSLRNRLQALCKGIAMLCDCFALLCNIIQKRCDCFVYAIASQSSTITFE